MSDTILSTLASKQTSVACEDQIDHQSLGRNEEDACEDDEVTDDSSNETVSSNSQLQQDRPSPLTSSACREEADRPCDSGEHTFKGIARPFYMMVLLWSCVGQWVEHGANTTYIHIC